MISLFRSTALRAIQVVQSHASLIHSNKLLFMASRSRHVECKITFGTDSRRVGTTLIGKMNADESIALFVTISDAIAQRQNCRVTLIEHDTRCNNLGAN